MSVNRFFPHLIVTLTIFTLTFSLLPTPVFAKQAEPPPGYLPLQPYNLPARLTVLDKQIFGRHEKI
ncbi:hypothetical protein [Sporomusa acidovorans]|uniref:Uncharacterized protein n=1 Tax=Sporomusa acidovorans (strain ATCC 49682 / DSM 3132 / Mol) TaxID=1123286 RepID=A0ABZ3IVZ0_SPOA4|nr:hypothetical protein [Sporomusa acidovorans]OZC15277.1 hypothetical protein SPACI_50150 [Sporomusa acidovorans DSM 3132]SDE91890.1 hypothetical protein SAMN04488499_102650 [Sporomusa acidovorans]